MKITFPDLSKETSSAFYKNARWAFYHIGLWWKDLLTPARYSSPLFLVATFRTGSNLLIEYLNCIPGVFFQGDGEIFRAGKHRDFYTMWNHRESKAAALRHLKRSLKVSGKEFPGIKLPFDHLDIYGITFDDVISRHPGARYIILYRHSLLETYVSALKSLKTGVFHYFSGENVSAGCRVHVDRNAFKGFCVSRKAHYEKCLNHPVVRQNSIVLNYETLISDKDMELGRVCRFLGVTQRPAFSAMHKKQAVGDVRDSVLNYDEIRDIAESPLACLHLPPGPERMAGANDFSDRLTRGKRRPD